MQTRRHVAQLLESATGGLPMPRMAKAGALVIAAGLFVDLIAHTLPDPIGHVHLGAFAVEEHLAHLVVVVGMVLVLAGIVGDGIRSQRRQVRQEGTVRHAVR